MGLDMYLEGEKYYWSCWGAPEKNLKEDGFDLKTKRLRIGYWRKHPNLHGYIVQTFADGKDECQDIELSEKDVEKIIAAVKAKKLPPTSGFFFGQSEGSEEERDEDIQILTKALEWMRVEEDGVSRSIVYRASW